MKESSMQTDAIIEARWTAVKSELARKGWYHSFELPGGHAIDGLVPLSTLRHKLSLMPIPDDLRGMRVLDIGAWDGWYSFEMERRGAQVTAVDCVELDTFRHIHRLLGSKVEYREMDVMELSPKELGYFDIVLFLGVLYHLKHPLLSLEKVCELTRDLAIVESYVLADSQFDSHTPALLEFYETTELGGQLDNWCAPNMKCLSALCRTAGFARVDPVSRIEDRGCVACYRKWPAKNAVGAAPRLVTAVHNRDRGFNFYSQRDEYISCAFECGDASLSVDDIFPQVDEYGVRPVYATKIQEDSWMINFKLPPGLAPGWHDVRLRVKDSARSNAIRIAVDLPAFSDALAIVGIADGVTWNRGEVHRANGGFVSLWIRGLPENADFHNLRIYVDGRRQQLQHLAPPDLQGNRQLNLQLEPSIQPGEYEVTLRFGTAEQQSARLTVR